MNELKMQKMTILTTDVQGAFPGSEFDKAAADNAMRFHRSLPDYRETELRSLNAAARENGVRAIFIKDESTRFGLNAFKGLGGSYAVFRILCDKFGMDHTTAVFSDFLTEDIRKKCSDIVFVTATDGNHGKGVAWAAKLFGCKAYVYMPVGSVEERRKAIEDAGAESVVITDLNYDLAVEYSNRMAEENGWILVQDTAWDGYETIPQWIVEGYLTMAAEICEQLGDRKPTHVFLQAGVGAMAGGVLGYLSNIFSDNEPIFTIVEPSTVACLYLSAKMGDGDIHSVLGDPVTIMAGLNCGTPCRITWPVIRDRAKHYCACSDEIAENGMRALAHPAEGDEAIVAGECGGVTYGAFREIISNDESKRLLGIDEDSVILLISSEGDTDKDNYRRVVYGK